MNSYYCIDLNNYFNFKQIGKDIPDTLFSIYDKNSKEYLYDPSTLPGPLEIIKIENVPFTFPDTAVDKYDRIMCEEQLIRFPPAEYISLMALGTTDTVEFSEKAELYCGDKLVEQIELFFYSDWTGRFGWGYDYPNENCRPALFPKLNIGGAASIYYYKTDITCNRKDIDGIRLPMNPNMHIYSITLEYIA